MALFHVHASVIHKGDTGGARGFAAYLLHGHAAAHAQYLERAGRDDLVASGSAALPTWARAGEHFWQMAQQYEWGRSAGKRRGVVARCYQITLPRELSPAARLLLADDLRTACFAGYPQTWAVHNPHGRDGQEQPHLHVMFSPRPLEASRAEAPSLWFSNRDAGARKDARWEAREHLVTVRCGMATLINAALERDGVPQAVSSLSLQARGITRPALHYDGGRDTPELAEDRLRLRQEFQPWENEANRAAWHQQQQREGLTDLSRAALVAQVREQIWEPERWRERQQARQLTHHWDQTRQQVRHRPTREHVQQVEHQRALAWALDDTPCGGVWWREEEREWSR